MCWDYWGKGSRERSKCVGIIGGRGAEREVGIIGGGGAEREVRCI